MQTKFLKVLSKTFEQLKYSRLYDLFVPVAEMFEYFVWILRGRATSTPHIIKERLVRKYAKDYSCSTFIETGTYLGVMVRAVKDLFDKVYTIEIDKKLYARAKRKFRGNRKIKVMRGDSSKILPTLLQRIKSPALFWLDAHFSGGITGSGESMTPIKRELEHILLGRFKNCVILIDDAHLFNGKNNYPSINALNSILAKVKGRKNIRIKDDIIVFYTPTN